MYMQTHNRRIHYKLENFSPERSAHSRPTIVFIHGLGQNLTCWDTIVPYLSKYRIIRYDIAGHGESDPPVEETYRMATFRDELHALLGHLDVGRVTLCGFELGACIALHYARHHADRIERIISIAHPVFYPDSIRLKKYEQKLKTLQEKGITHYTEETLAALSDKSNVDGLKNAYLQVPLHTYRSVIQMINEADLVTDFKQCICPIMQMIGDQDELYPPQLMQQAIHFFPATILVQVPNAKSLVHIDNPEYTAKRIDSFISQQTAQFSDPLVREASLYYLALRRQQPGYDQQASEPYLRIQVMQQFEVSVNSRPLSGNWKIRKAYELLIYLLLHKNVHRDKLYDLFWPHLNLENAQNMLRVSINHLKKLVDKPFGTTFIQSKRDRIELSGLFSSDLLEFLNDIESFHANKNESEKEAIAKRISQSVTPRLFEGYYSDWIMSLRDDIFQAAAPIIRWVAHWYERQDRLMDSVYYYKQLIHLMPDEWEVMNTIAQLYERLHLKGIAGEWNDKYLRAASTDE